MAAFSSFHSNVDVNDINKVLFDAVFQYGDLFNTCTAMNGVQNGQYVHYLDKMADLGWAGRQCNPEYKNANITGREQQWALGNWSAPIKLCYSTLEETIAKYCLKTGTPRENVDGTIFREKIFMPLLTKALERAYWRMAWFSDTQAKLVSASGVLKAGTDTTLFTMADGLWKKVFAATATSHHTSINANSKSGATYASQAADIKATGVAVGIVESILSDASSLIENGVLMMSKSLVDALRIDYRKEYKQTIPFYEVAEGVKLEQYDGVSILPVPEWDTVIREYEDDGTKFNLPHRAIYTNVENLLVGTSDTSLFAEMQSGFNDETRINWNYIASNIGTLVSNPELIQAAY